MIRKRRNFEAANPIDGNFLGRWSRRKVRAKTDALPDTLEDDLKLETEAKAAGTGAHQSTYQPGRMITDAPVDHDAPADRDAGDSDAGRPAVELSSLDPSRSTAGDVAAGHAADKDVSDEDFAGQDWDKFDFDALDGESDYARFMGKNIPDHIRAKALKKLWTSNPLFGHMDLLDDYAEDFTDAVWVVPNLRTDYKVGRGFMTDEEVAEWEALGAESKQRAAEEQLARDKARAKGDGPPPGGDIVIAPESPDQAEIAAMLAASDAYYDALYPDHDNHHTPMPDLLAPNVRFLVARLNGKISGYGSLLFGNSEMGELQRMWVEPAARGNGIGRRLVAALETAALERNLDVVRLKTGQKQTEALNLYRSCGYLERGAFGGYEPASHRIFMEKRLPAAEQTK